MWRLDEDIAEPEASSGANHTDGAAVLAVGDTAEWIKRKRPVPPGGRIILAAFQDLSSQLLEVVRPGLVVSPLLARDFDCIDLAQLLHRLSYSGQYRVICDDLPAPRVVKAEIRSLCPGLDFDILETNVLKVSG